MSKKVTEAPVCSVRHIAFIMDGNGRWAKKRGMPREYGHKAGAKTFERILDRCAELDIEAATFYVFSTENWKRSEREVNALMNLLENYLGECEKQIKSGKKKVRFIFLGDKSIFTPSLRQKMLELEEITKDRQTIVNLAINYGGRDEIVNAANRLSAMGKRRFTEEDFSSAMYTSESPELDMVVRTGGDLRISNFLLWQTAYAELYFTDKLWPDMTVSDVDAVIENFKTRKRRFGGV